MTDIKVRARLLIRGKVFSLWIKSILPFFLLAASFLCGILPFMSVFYGVYDTLIPLDGRYVYAVIICLAAASVFIFVFSFIRKCYSEAAVFYLLDKNGTAPASYFRFSQGLRYFRMKLLVVFYKLCWGSVFMFPSLFLFYVLFTGVYNGPMIKSIFVTLLITGVLLFVCGVFFMYTVSSRYYLCDYLFYLYPLSPVRSLVSSSVLLCRKKLLYITFCRISILPWKLFGLFVFSLPFSRVFTKCIKAVLCESVYGEKKYSRKKPAVVFYIGKNTVFVPQTENG